MSEAPELETRVTRLEERMAEVHHLASRADHEASDVHARLRAHTKSLEALRETQLEQGREMRKRFAQVDDHFAKIDDRFAKIDDRFGKIDDRFGKLDDRFGKLEAKVDAGFAKVDDNFGRLETWVRGGFATMARAQEQITALLTIAVRD